MRKTLDWRRLAGLALALALGRHPAAAQAAPALMCTAPQAQSPCGAQTAYGPAGEPAADAGIANPVHLFTGEKFLRDTDLPASLPGGHPSFIRLYRSGTAVDGPLGRGWTSEYDIRLQTAPDGWLLAMPDGRRVRFDAQGRSTAPGEGQILRPDPARAHPEDPHTFWRSAGGQQLDFDRRGRLRRITVPGQPDIVITPHDEGPLRDLMQTIRRGNAVLRLDYDRSGPQPRLHTLSTPLGLFR
jgi:hypothetical protein